MSSIKDTTKTVTAIAAFLAAIGSAAPAAAQGHYSVAPDRDIRQCVQAIGDRADYDGAARVQHEVSSKERMTIGYTLKIKTSVFDQDGGTVREYSTTCVATGGDAPRKVDFQQKKSGV